MSVLNKNINQLPSDGGVTFKGKFYKVDYMITFPIDKDKINLDNCICVFSILNRVNPLLRKYVGGKFYENLNNENVIESINGYLPETVFCFTDSYFPLDEFLEENNFQYFGS